VVITHGALMLVLAFSAFHRIHFRVFRRTWHAGAAFSAALGTLVLRFPVLWFPRLHF